MEGEDAVRCVRADQIEPDPIGKHSNDLVVIVWLKDIAAQQLQSTGSYDFAVWHRPPKL
jgi:hypothetical protein